MRFTHTALNQCLSSALAIAASIFFARNLSLERFGEFALISSIGFLFSTLNNSCIQQSLLGQRYERKTYFVNTALLLNLITVSVIYLLGFLILSLLEFKGRDLALFIFVTFSLKEFLRKRFVTDRNFFLLTTLEILSGLTLLMAIFYFMHTPTKLQPELIMGVTYAVPALIMANYLIPKLSQVRLKELVEILKYVAWLLPTSILGLFGIPAIPIVLGAMANVEVVGVYRALQSIFGVSNVLNQIYDTWLQPETRASQNENILNQIQILNLICIFIFGLVIFYFGQDFFGFLYGKELTESNYFNRNIITITFLLFSSTVLLTVERVRLKIFGTLKNLMRGAAIYFWGSIATYCFAYIFDYANLIFIGISLAISLTALNANLSTKNSET